MRQGLGAILEAPALIPGLDDVAVVGEAIDAPRDSIRIILREIPALHFGAGGKTKETTEPPPG